MLSTRSAGRLVSGAATFPSSQWNCIRRQNNNIRIFFTRYSTGTGSPRAAASRPQSRLRRALGFTTLAVLAFTTGLSIAPIQIASKVMTVGAPTDAESLESFQPPDERSQAINTYIMTHPLSHKLRNLPNYGEVRPHMKLPVEFRSRHLIAGLLLGPNRVVIPPLVFHEKSGKALVAITYLGQEVSGHPGIVHGGMLATLLDEGLARCCFPVLPNGIGVTANLSIDYKKPVMADSYVVLRAETVKHEGRKAWVEGRLETLPEGDEEPVVLVQAKGLFIEPKYAANLPTLYKAAT